MSHVFKKGNKIMGLSFQTTTWDELGIPRPMLVAGRIVRIVNKPHLGICYLVKLVPGLKAPFPRTKSGQWWIQAKNATEYTSSKFKKALILWREWNKSMRRAKQLHIRLAEEIY